MKIHKRAKLPSEISSGVNIVISFPVVEVINFSPVFRAADLITFLSGCLAFSLLGDSFFLARSAGCREFISAVGDPAGHRSVAATRAITQPLQCRRQEAGPSITSLITNALTTPPSPDEDTQENCVCLHRNNPEPVHDSF
uniref:PPUP8664 n=1 Tax=Poeciliopsis prolifica TaxID=188132 RepID=A0A0S7EVA0_9TELE